MTKLVIAFSRQNYATLFPNKLGDPYIPSPILSSA